MLGNIGDGVGTEDEDSAVVTVRGVQTEVDLTGALNFIFSPDVLLDV